MKWLTLLVVWLFPAIAWAGGTIPQGLGMYADGRIVDTVPAGTSIRWWAYGNFATPRTRDILAYALASVDYETLKFSVLYGADAPTAQVMVAWSFSDEPVWPGCNDGNPATVCPGAQTLCLESTRGGSNSNLCSSYRVRIYVNNLIATSSVPWEDRLYGIIRHEQGHVMGLAHDSQGPMASGDLPFTACQRAKWAAFSVDPAVTTWSYPAVTECQ
jgi:hypothetical protein